MTLENLKELIKKNNIPDTWYSIYDGDKYDAHMLNKSSSLWEYYYVDERGNKSLERYFLNEDDACDYLWSLFLFRLRFYKR